MGWGGQVHEVIEAHAYGWGMNYEDFPVSSIDTYLHVYVLVWEFGQHI